MERVPHPRPVWMEPLTSFLAKDQVAKKSWTLDQAIQACAKHNKHSFLMFTLSRRANCEKCDLNGSTKFSVWRKIRHEDESIKQRNIINPQSCHIASQKYPYVKWVLDRRVMSRIFSKVLICSRETCSLGFDEESHLPGMSTCPTIFFATLENFATLPAGRSGWKKYLRRGTLSILRAP